MINDPELRRLLEEEAKVILKEDKSLVAEDTETLKRKRKLRNRYNEIERLLSSHISDEEMIARGHRRLRSFTFFLTLLVILLGVCFLLESRHLRHRLNHFEQKLERSVVEEIDDLEEPIPAPSR